MLPWCLTVGHNCFLLHPRLSIIFHYKDILLRAVGSSSWRTQAATVSDVPKLVSGQLVRLLGREVSPSPGLYLYRTTQHRKTRTNLHDLNGIRNHDPSIQAAKTRALDSSATVITIAIIRPIKLNKTQLNYITDTVMISNRLI